MFSLKITRRNLAVFAVITSAMVVTVVSVEATATTTTETGTATVTVLPAPDGTGAATAVRRQAESLSALPACTTEDGSTQRACYWDAQRMGNGKGWSFVSMNYGQETIYVSWLPAPCKAVSQLPAYDVKINSGAMIHNPSGTDLIAEAMADGTKGRDLTRMCNAVLGQWADDHN